MVDYALKQLRVEQLYDARNKLHPSEDDKKNKELIDMGYVAIQDYIDDVVEDEVPGLSLEVESYFLDLILKGYGLNRGFIQPLSYDIDGRGVVIHRWAYNDPDDRAHIELYSDLYLDINFIDRKKRAEGDISFSGVPLEK